MQTQQTEVTKGNGRTRGRRDQTTEQETAFRLAPIRQSIAELVTLYTQQCESAARFSDAIKVTAEKSGLLASVVSKYVKARAGDQFQEAKRKVVQLSLIFELGE